ncbi:MAG: hypothetical protein PGN25_01605 [Methylorubrum populi]
MIGCTSLANLRSLLRSTGGGPGRRARARRRSEIRSRLQPRGTARRVTGLADHVALNGRAYDCLALKGTAVCHWTAAGAVTPPERPAVKPARGK